MRIIYEHRQVTAGSLAQLLYPDTNGHTATSVVHHGRGDTLSRLVRGVVARVARFRERRATTEQLSRMSDYALADIGLCRGQLHRVFEPEFAGAMAVPHRAEDDVEEQVLAELGLSRRISRPHAGR